MGAALWFRIWLILLHVAVEHGFGIVVLNYFWRLLGMMFLLRVHNHQQPGYQSQEEEGRREKKRQRREIKGAHEDGLTVSAIM